MSNQINIITVNVNHIKHSIKTKHNLIDTENIVNDINTTENISLLTFLQPIIPVIPFRVHLPPISHHFIP